MLRTLAPPSPRGRERSRCSRAGYCAERIRSGESICHSGRYSVGSDPVLSALPNQNANNSSAGHLREAEEKSRR